ncbi:hypothetical protein A0H81_11310 [Grifola frondosa]|uniref:Uncharacterized protein n=1 Tax=Grifola frondosa TaxID=5627 RepID=A0A1C7LXV5_GRIFR|nr:hypothetical protein A0H81_11310 [Grifola frondosa]
MIREMRYYILVCKLLYQELDCCKLFKISHGPSILAQPIARRTPKCWGGPLVVKIGEKPGPKLANIHDLLRKPAEV